MTMRSAPRAPRLAGERFVREIEHRPPLELAVIRGRDGAEPASPLGELASHFLDVGLHEVLDDGTVRHEGRPNRKRRHSDERRIEFVRNACREAKARFGCRVETITVA
jgi:hypothetical protein